jgi:hypothetical protein
MRLSSYHSDGARELCGIEVQQYLASIGAKSTWITADVPQENGFFERSANRAKLRCSTPDICPSRYGISPSLLSRMCTIALRRRQARAG